jgi:Reverse transcriptase (RNA-dependent DNA polymerase)/Endonuclease-reverse transcriptase
MICIGQINLGRGRAATLEVFRWAMLHKLDVLLLQEPSVDALESLQGENSCRVLLSGRIPAAAIIVLNNYLTIRSLPHLSDEWCVSLQIYLGRRAYVLTSSYFQYAHPTMQHIARVEKVLAGIDPGMGVVVGADVNAQSLLWAPDCPRNKSSCDPCRVAPVEEMILRHGLVVLNNTTSPPTFFTVRASSHIDVTLVSSNMADVMADWRVRDEVVLSDHRLLTYRLGASGCGCTERQKLPPMFRIAGDWSRFRGLLERGLDRESRLAPLTDCHEAAARVQSVLVNAAECAIGRKPKKLRTTKIAWWTKEVENLRAAVRSAMRRLQRAKKRYSDDALVTYLEAYRRCRREFKRGVEMAKRDHWRRLCSAVGNSDPWGQVYRIVTHTRVPVPSAIRIRDGTIVADPAVAGGALLDALLPTDDPATDSECHRLVRADAELTSGGEDLPPLTEREMELIVRGIGPGRAPGIDRVTGRMIREGWPVLARTVTGLLQRCLDCGVFPDCWKVAVLVVLKKKNEKAPTDPKAYRLIALLPILGKLLERVVVDRLESYLANNAPLSGKQYGFSKGRSTTDAILNLVNKKHTSPKKYVIAIFLDVSGAFDAAWWPMILSKLRQRGIPGSALSLIRSYFTNRKVILDTGVSLESRAVNRGCPQGSVLGPFLWKVLYDDMLELPLPADCSLQAFADDATVVIEADSRHELEQKSCSALSQISAWGRLNKLSFAPEKTEALLIKGSLSLANIRIVWHATPETPTGIKIRFAREVTYLGVVLDMKLNFSSHVDRITKRATHSFYKMMGATGRDWGLQCGALKLIYKGLFLGMTTYACPSWASRLKTVGMRGALLRGQRPCLVAVTKAYCTTPTVSLPVISGLLPLDLQIEIARATYELKRGQPVTLNNEIINVNVDSINLAIKQIKAAALVIWQKRWDDSLDGRTTYSFFPSIADRLRMTHFEPDFHVTQFITGHGGFGSYFARFHISQSEQEAFCSCNDQSSEHYLWDCEQLQNERELLFSTFYLDGKMGPLGHADLVSTKSMFSAFRSFCVSFYERAHPH